MSILINLLPDIRQAKLKELRRRQLISGVAISIWVVCGAVVAIMSVYAAGQKVYIGQLTNRIAENKKQLEAVPGIAAAYNAEQHLASLPGLYDRRVYFTKFLQAYSESSPNDVSLTSMTVDSQNALIVSGFGTSYAAVAKLARAVEAANVKVGSSSAESNLPYFSSVSITNVSNAAPRGINFTINAVLEPGVTSGSN